ncbi:hypothetical protein PPYR_09671, partial [Photinus pyralis]
ENESNTTVQDMPLSKDILKIIGVTEKQNQTDSFIRKELVASWLDIVKRRLSEDVRTECVLRYPPPTNCKFLEAPKLNVEVAAATNVASVNRDNRLLGFQKQLGCSISAIGRALSLLLEQDGNTNLQLVRSLSDAGKLLVDLFSSYSSTRKELLALGLSKEFKDTLHNAEVDDWLFGINLDERLRASKNLEKVSQELRPAKPKAPVAYREAKNSRGRSLFPRVRRDRQPFHQRTRPFYSARPKSLLEGRNLARMQLQQTRQQRRPVTKRPWQH